jgi:ABC-2 type transport system ATP-binding protein
MAAIEVSGLSKRYGALEAVAGIDLEVAAGELVAVLGPNGAGKTTTIQILEGLTPRTAGDVRVLGVDPEGAGRDFRDRIGVMLQQCVTEPLLRVGELVDLHRSFYSKPRPADAVLRLVGLGGTERAMVRTLSGGQQRRVDLALALVGDPELVFLDEPTTGFDPEARRRAWEVITTLQDDGVTILLSTHYLEEAERLADRIIVLAHGRVVAEGPPRTLGNRAARAGHITLDPIAGVDPVDLPVLVELDQGRWHVRGEDLTTALHELTGWALAEGHRLDSLTVAGATLDDIYSEVVA